MHFCEVRHNFFFIQSKFARSLRKSTGHRKKRHYTCKPSIPAFKMVNFDHFIFKKSFQINNVLVILVMSACQLAREQFEICRVHYEKLAELIPAGQYYRYHDSWSFLTQKVVFLIALTIFLEAGFLVERDTVAEILGCM